MTETPLLGKSEREGKCGLSFIDDRKSHKLSHIELVCKEGNTLNVHLQKNEKGKLDDDRKIFVVSYFEIGLKKKKYPERTWTLSSCFHFHSQKITNPNNYAILFSSPHINSIYTTNPYKNLKTSKSIDVNDCVLVPLKTGYDDWLAWRGTFLYIESDSHHNNWMITAQLFKKKSGKLEIVTDEYGVNITLNLKCSFRKRSSKRKS